VVCHERNTAALALAEDSKSDGTIIEALLALGNCSRQNSQLDDALRYHQKVMTSTETV
jgi:lipopolysaccharide biosynthesis regulator YciM